VAACQVLYNFDLCPKFRRFFGQRIEIKPVLIAAGDYRVVESKNVPISGDAHTLDYMLRQTSEIWRVANVLADVPITRTASHQFEIRAPFVDGGAPALLNRVHKYRGAVRQHCATSRLHARFPG
jgi:hypothetical protein